MGARAKKHTRADTVISIPYECEVDPQQSAGRRTDPASPEQADVETRSACSAQDPAGQSCFDDRAVVSVTRQPTAPRMTLRVGQVCMQFGVNPQPDPIQIVDHLALELKAGSVVLLSGPSGSGKSAVLQAIEQKYPRSHAVHRASLSYNRSVVDVVGAHLSFSETLQLLTCCGLGEPRLWLRSYNELSDGEQFRAKLAKCIALHPQSGRSELLLCDEFCAVLHRRAAKAISYNLRKLVTKLGLKMVLATSNTDLLTDLQPDQHIQLVPERPVSVSHQQVKKKPISFRRRLMIERGGKRDYQEFAPMHYRRTDELGFVDCVFLLREKTGGEKLAIVVYSHPPMELKLRNQVLKGRFKRKPRLLNKEMRILRRLVVHPDVRGCGLGHYLVRKTLPMVGVPFVECLASMGRVNPVFEKSGMKLIGECAMPPNRAKLLEDLKALGTDPFEPDFVNQVCRRPRVRKIVASLVYQWYQATTGQGEKRVAKQSPQFLAQTFRGLVGTLPVYYLWRRKDG